jgi:nucleoside-diphosphate-sugar epimerase
MPTLLSFGHGYSARRLGRDLIAEGWRVIGTTRSEETAAALRAEGVEPAPFPPPPAMLDEADHLLTSVPPGEDGDPVLAALGDEIAKRRFAWIGVLSTTGVYGDWNGAWVDEDAPRCGTSRRALARIAAEDAWLALSAPERPVHVFRLAGIYGPGRGPFAKVRNGTARRILKEGQVFSRIHVDDIALALRASIARPDPGRVYNVNDDLPAPPEDVLEGAATLLGLPPPPAVRFEDAEMSPMARSFYADCKRTTNRRLREELGVELRHPTWREGLAAILAEEG